jgi:hypothetical protein
VIRRNAAPLTPRPDVHPDPEQLSLSLGDGPSLWPRAIARAHRATCPQCQRVTADLSNVTTVLASTQAPPRPPPLATRVDSALAGEIVRRGKEANLSASARAR